MPPSDEIAGVTDLMVSAQSLENPAVNIDAYDALVDGSMISASGHRVNHNTATRLGAVWQATLQIASDISKLQLELYQRDREGDMTLAREHPAYFPVKTQPNDEQVAVKFWRRSMIHLLLWGNAYIWVEWQRMNGRLVPQLLLLLPDRTWPERQDGDLFYVSEVGGTLQRFESEEVMHLENFINREGTVGMDPTQEARDAWGLALAKQGFSSKFFKHGGRVGGFLEIPARMPTKMREGNEANFRRAYENPDEAFRMVPLRDGAKFHQSQFSLSDTQLVESTHESVVEVARWFNMKPSRLGVEGGQYYGSKAEDNRDYLDTTLSPHMAMIRSECERVLLTPEERRSERYVFRWNVDQMLQPTRLERYQAHQIGISSEFLSPNEARRMEGLNRRPGGDTFGNPNINPQSHVEAIVAVVTKKMQEVANRDERRKTPLDGRWQNVVMSHLAEAVAPPIGAFSAVFGGVPEKLANQVCENLVVEYRGLARDMAPKAAFAALPIYQIVERSLQ